MADQPWQLRIFAKSLKKKEKLKLLEKNLTVHPTERVLDLGCAQGMLSYFLRRKGGFWVSTDQDFSNLKQTQLLVQKNLAQTGPSLLPFKNGSLDLVVCLDYLEHVEDDTLCLAEIGRVLKKDGRLVLVTPHTGRFFLLHKLRSALGLKLEYFGHKREGYGLEELELMLEKTHFQVFRHQTYSRFFSEFLELLINFVYIKILSPKSSLQLRDGHIRPADSSEFEYQQKTFKLYSLIYPVVWFSSRLDSLLFFQKGYSLMVWAQKSSEPEKA